jgi:hypothetical protein
MAAVRTARVLVTLTPIHVQCEVLRGNRDPRNMEILVYVVCFTVERKITVCPHEIYICFRFDGVCSRNAQLLSSNVAKCEGQKGRKECRKT